jgi:hypothetical protein
MPFPRYLIVLCAYLRPCIESPQSEKDTEVARVEVRGMGVVALWRLNLVQQRKAGVSHHLTPLSPP